MHALPVHCIPYAGGSVGDRWRANQLLRQLPPQDTEVRYCHGLSDEEKRELRLFSAQRRHDSLGRATVLSTTVSSKCHQVVCICLLLVSNRVCISCLVFLRLFTLFTPFYNSNYLSSSVLAHEPHLSFCLIYFGLLSSLPSGHQSVSCVLCDACHRGHARGPDIQPLQKRIYLLVII